MERILNVKKVQEFESYLRNEERSEATVEKYVRDVRFFEAFVGNAEISKQIVLEYKNRLIERYAVARRTKPLSRNIMGSI